MLNNASYLNKHLYIFKLSDNKPFSFCNQEDETIINLFVNCPKSKTLWNSLKEFFKDTINLILLTPQSVIFGSLDSRIISCSKLSSAILKYYLYVSRYSKSILLAALKTNIEKNIFWKKVFPNTKKGTK